MENEKKIKGFFKQLSKESGKTMPELISDFFESKQIKDDELMYIIDNLPDLYTCEACEYRSFNMMKIYSGCCVKCKRGSHDGQSGYL